MKKIVLICALMIAVLLVVGCADTTSTSSGAGSTSDAAETPASPAQAEAPAAPALTVTATKLGAAYTGNEVKADKKYKDKVAEITGKVGSVDVMFGQTSVTLKNETSDFEIVDVLCGFKDEAEINKVAELNEGDKVTIIGTISGKSLAVSVDDCRFK